MELVKKLYQKKDTWFQIYLSTNDIYEFQIYEFNSVGADPIFRIQMAEWSIEFINKIISALISEWSNEVNHQMEHRSDNNTNLEMQTGAKEQPLIRVKLNDTISPLFCRAVQGIAIDNLSVDIDMKKYTNEILEQFINSFTRINQLYVIVNFAGQELIDMIDYLTQEKYINKKIISVFQNIGSIKKMLESADVKLDSRIILTHELIGRRETTNIIIN